MKSFITKSRLDVDKACSGGKRLTFDVMAAVFKGTLALKKGIRVACQGAGLAFVSAAELTF